ncbi:hypothetical protein HUU05_22420 [candidate division KSB1 bacterium]|nr:hypothetical protein [candidate division KSB1 bacterium]
MDCADPEGNVVIGYSANLSWKKIGINYANRLLYDAEHGVDSRTTLLRQDPPHMAVDTLTWSPSRLKISAGWKSLAPPIDKTLLTLPQGNLRWICHQPKAHATIQLQPQVSRIGLGYTEKLEMSIAPWELPFVELRWGRFLSATDTLIWIDWRGEVTATWVFYQGAQVNEALVTDESVSFDRGAFMLRCRETVILREGPLISTALSKIPGLKEVFPSSILNTYECKWRSKGQLTKPDHEVSAGWAIHEVVKWKTAPV